MRTLLGLVLLAVVVGGGLLAAGLIKNRLPWGEPPGFAARIRTYLDSHGAETEEGSPFPELRPRHYEGIGADQLFATIEEAIGHLPGWRIVERDAGRKTLHAVITSAVWRFRDDAGIWVEPDSANDGAVLFVRSVSRVGRGDLGANTRHILNLYAQLDGMIAPPRTAAYKTPPARTTPLF